MFMKAICCCLSIWFVYTDIVLYERDVNQYFGAVDLEQSATVGDLYQAAQKELNVHNWEIDLFYLGEIINKDMMHMRIPLADLTTPIRTRDADSDTIIHYKLYYIFETRWFGRNNTTLHHRGWIFDLPQKLTGINFGAPHSYQTQFEIDNHVNKTYTMYLSNNRPTRQLIFSADEFVEKITVSFTRGQNGVLEGILFETNKQQSIENGNIAFAGAKTYIVGGLGFKLIGIRIIVSQRGPNFIYGFQFKMKFFPPIIQTRPRSRHVPISHARKLLSF
eukprot:57560_1